MPKEVQRECSYTLDNSSWKKGVFHGFYAVDNNVGNHQYERIVVAVVEDDFDGTVHEVMTPFIEFLD